MTSAGRRDVEERRRRTSERLQIIDAVVWATGHGHQLLDIVSAAATPEHAVAEVMRIAMVPEICAAAIIETQIRRWTVDEVRRLKDEQSQLLAALREYEGQA